MEDTHLVEPERLERLITVLTLALCWCYQGGDWLDRQHPIEVKKHQRRVCSVIRLGLDALRRLVLNAATKAIELQRMIQLLFAKTSVATSCYG